MKIPTDATATNEKDQEMLSSLVDSLCRRNNGFSGAMRRNHHDQPLPSRDVIVDVVEALRSVLFPGYFGFSGLSVESVHFHVGSVLDRIRPILKREVKRGLCFSCREDMRCCDECDNRAQAVTEGFFARLPAIQRMLASDVRAAYESDPASSSPDEVIFCYPGLRAVTDYRLAHELHRQGVPVIPRMITEYAHSETGIDIHPGASIGNCFFIDHGTGVVIGETCIIGDRVRLYQGVTLGARSFKLDGKGRPVKGVPRHPIVEDDVTIYSGATILGRVTIGKGSVIGGNVWLVESVPPMSRISQAEARQKLYENGDGI